MNGYITPIVHPHTPTYNQKKYVKNSINIYPIPLLLLDTYFTCVQDNLILIKNKLNCEIIKRSESKNYNK